MKFNLFVPTVLCLVLAASACTRKTTGEAQVTPPASPTQPKTDNSRPESEPKKEVYEVIGFQKTACFGKCPVFQVKISNDGKATWYGKMNVEKLGWYEAQVTQDMIKSIKDKAQSLKYWDMEGEYPQGRKVADLPSTVTFIRKGDMLKQVVNTHQAPESLEEFEDYLEDIINGLRWTASASK